MEAKVVTENPQKSGSDNGNNSLLSQKETKNKLKNGNNSSLSQEETKYKLKQGFQDFVLAVNEALNDMTALEVNTIIASNITGTKFIAEEAYQNIFFCLTPNGNIPTKLSNELKIEIETLDYLIERNKDIVGDQRIPFSFKDDEDIKEEVLKQRPERYIKLRKKLAIEYKQIFFDRIYDKEGNKSTKDDKLPPGLPFPFAIEKPVGYPINLVISKDLKDILKDSRFLRSLRKINELKAAADRGDVIFAQTVVQLDGDIINRYREDIFKDSNKDLLIKIHNEGVSAGEKQWNGLLSFIVNLVKGIIWDTPRNGR